MKKFIAFLPIFCTSPLYAVIVSPIVDPTVVAQKIHQAVQQGEAIEKVLDQNPHIKILPPDLRQQICIEYFFLEPWPHRAYNKLLPALRVSHELSIQDYLDHGFGPDDWSRGGGTVLHLGGEELTSLVGMRALIKRLGDQAQNITELKLSHNQIRVVGPGELQGLGNLKTLWLDFNLIHTIGADAFQGLNTLEALFLNNNKIETIAPGAFQNLSKLQRLVLSENLINTLVAGMFQGLSNLQELTLHSNQIVTIATGAFQDLSNVRKIYLSKNKIRTIAPSALQGLSNKLEHLELDFHLIPKKEWQNIEQAVKAVAPDAVVI